METMYYWRGTGKLLHMMRWSRPDMYNLVRDLSRHMSVTADAQVVAMYRVMACCVATPHQGWKLKPRRELNRVDKTIEFLI